MLQKGDEPIPGYKLEAFLGKGTFGEVWRASAPFGVKVALKFIDVSGKAGLKEFRGIQRVKDIRHAHLMPITAIWMLDEYGQVLDEKAVANLEKPVRYDATATMSLQDVAPLPNQRSASLLIVAMLLADDSLKARMERCVEETGEGIPLEELLDYMEQAARGIDHLNLHEHETENGRATIQHCDIKPENMMLVGDSVVICDFGLAQLLGDAQRTATGMLGTPAYIAPEVLLTQRPTPTTDQYSLACTYLHLRSGQLPFDPTSSLPAVFEIHKTGKLKFEAISGTLEKQVVRKAASVDPTKRFKSNLEFARELRLAVDRDLARSQEDRSVKLKRIGKRAAVVLATLSVLAGIGYMSSPLGAGSREALVANIRSWFEKPDPPPPPPKREEAFQLERKVIVERAEMGQWETALQQAHGLAESFPQMEDEVADLRQEVLDQILVSSRRQLDDPDGAAILGAAAILQDLADHPLPGREAVEAQAQLVYARALARQGKWSQVESRLTDVTSSGGQLDASQAKIFVALSILRQCAEGIDRFMDDAVLDHFEQLGGTLSPDVTGWEADKIDDLKVAAFAELERGKFTNELADPRLATIFPQGLRVLQALTNVSQQLDADSPDFAAMRRQLDEAAANGDSASDARVKSLRAMVELRDGAVPLESAVAHLPQQLGNAAAAQRLTADLMRRADGAVVAGQVDDAVIDTIAEFSRRSGRYLSPAAAETLRTRQRAQRVINWHHQGDSDVDSCLADSQMVRDADVELDAQIKSLVDACWAECQLIRGADRAASRQLETVGGQLADFPADSPASPYVHYVRARIIADQGGRSAAKQALELLDADLTDPLSPRLTTAERSRFIGRLLVSAIESARSGGDSQIAQPAYRTEDADRAARWIEVAVSVGVESEEIHRDEALANFYRSAPNLPLVARVAGQLPLSASSRGDGHLLLVKAEAHRQLADPDLVQSLESVEQLLEWIDRFDNATPWETYQRVIQPALSLALTADLKNLREPEQAVDVTGVAAALRSPLASILSTSATIVHDNFETANTLYDGKELPAIEHRYYYFRAAAALEPQETGHLVGQYWALRDWPDRETKDKVDELFEIAQRAIQIDAEDPQANGIMGEAWVARSRREIDTQKRITDLDTAIAHFTKSLGPRSDRRTRENFLPLRSSAYVETAYLMSSEVGSCSQEKIGRLRQAIDDAEAASEMRFRRRPATAFLAWGNAAEDLAHYCHQDPDLHFRIAVEKFSTAATEAGGDTQVRSRALMALGRCLYRRAVYVAGKHRSDSGIAVVGREDELGAAVIKQLRDDVDGAVRELKEAEQLAQSDNTKSEVYFWLRSTFDLKEHVFRDATARAEADRYFRLAIELANSLTWAPLYWAFAQKAYFDGDYSEAVTRAQKILEEQAGQRYVVHWQWVFRALKLIFLATEPLQRERVLDEYAVYLPQDEPSATYYRVQWFLLGPHQLSPYDDYLYPNYIHDARRPRGSDWKPDFKALDSRAEQVAELARQYGFQKLEAQAATFLALSAYERWRVAGNPSEPGNAYLVDASKKLSVAAAKLLGNDYGGLGQATISIFAFRHAHLFASASQAATPGEEKTRIRVEETPRIRAFQRFVADQGLKAVLNDRLNRIQ